MNLFHRIRRGLSDRGVVSVEGAALGLVFITAFTVAADVVVSLRTRLKLEQVAGNLAANVTQFQNTISTTDLTALYDTAQQMAGSTQVTAPSGKVIITGITNDNGTVKIIWQKASDSGTTFTSSLSGTGTTLTNKLPDRYALPSGSSLIVVEVFTTVQPWVLSKGIMGNITGPMQAMSLFQPRTPTLPQMAAN